MNDDGRYSLESARAAADGDDLAGWVARFLASPGSDNADLAEKLCAELGWWIGPLRVPMGRLHRLAGPPGDPVMCPIDDEEWDARVAEMDELAEGGWEPPPVVVAFRGDRLVLEDGNHRVESLRRAGRRQAWAVIGFERREDRDRLAAELASLAPSNSTPE